MRPDIIFIFSDQQRADTVSPKITPELCKMAEEGAKFSSAYTCQPVCGPARACLQTGVYATQNGCVTNGIPMDDRGAHLADLFTAAGYETAYIGKWHLASADLNIATRACRRSCAAATNIGWRRIFWSSRRTEMAASCGTARAMRCVLTESERTR